MTNRERQINYLLTNGFKFNESTKTFTRDYDNIGALVVDNIFMECYFLPYKQFFMSVVTLKNIIYDVDRINDDLDHLKLNGCI